MMRVCLFDHHNYEIPTDGIGGVIGLFQILYEELVKLENVDITLLINDKTKLISDQNLSVVKLPFEEIENIRFAHNNGLTILKRI